MQQPGIQEAPIMRVKTGSFQAKPQPSETEKEAFTVSTARKSVIEAKGMCAVCGVRVNRDDLEPCAHCGSPLCPDCNKQAQKRGKTATATRRQTAQRMQQI
ncbi:MAG: hypothetical protein ABRQ26_16260 [Syntrophomonadaceae bacterium]